MSDKTLAEEMVESSSFRNFLLIVIFIALWCIAYYVKDVAEALTESNTLTREMINGK